MAHNLAKKVDKKTGKKTKKTSFVAVVDGTAARPEPWHGLGQRIDKLMTSKEAIELAGLNYGVEKVPLNWEFQSGKKKLAGVSERFTEVIRTDNGVSLGSVGVNYELVQNQKAFEFIDSLVGDGSGKLFPMFETAGALFEGQKIFITAKLPNQIKVGKDDIIDLYLMLYNAHDGSAGITAGLTPTRIVCNNTLNAALRNISNRVTMKHTKNVNQNFDLKKLMNLVNVVDKQLEEVFNKMAKVKIDDKRLKEYIAAVMSPGKEILTEEEFNKFSSRNLNLTNEILNYALTNETQQLASTKGTVFGAYNAITGYYQNMKDWKTQEEKFDSLVIRENSTESKRVQKAFDLAFNLMAN